MKRENSFLKQKQEQWAKEKETSNEWFPFGENMTPGSGSPLRKFESKSATILTAENTTTTDPVRDLRANKAYEEDMENEVMHRKSFNNNTREYIGGGGNNSRVDRDRERERDHNLTQSIHEHGGIPSSTSGYHGYSGVPLIPAYSLPYPYAVPPPQHSQIHPNQPPCPAEFLQHHPPPHPWAAYQYQPQYQVIPPGAIPVSTINIEPDQMAAFQAMWALPQPSNGMRYGIPIPPPFINPSMTSSVSSSESGVSGLVSKKESMGENQQNHQNHQKEPIRQNETTSDYNDEDSCPPPTRRGTINSYEDQIAERNRVLREEEERERREMVEAERQREELERRNENEEQKRKRQEMHRVEEEQRRVAQYVAAMEKYKKEAEDMKKVKAQKHRVICAQENGKLEEVAREMNIDMENAVRYLREITEIERHKRDDIQEIQSKSQPPAKIAGNGRKSEDLQRSRSSSISVSASPLNRNGYGRRSVRTTSREKAELKRDKEQEPAERTFSSRELPNRPVPAHSLLFDEEEMRSKVYHPVDRNASNAATSQDSYSDRIEDKDKDYSKLFLKSSMPSSTPINNSPRVLLQQKERRNGFDSMQTGLFAPIPTRASIRRAMRVPEMQSSPIASSEMPRGDGFVKPRSNSFETNEEMSSGGSLSPDLNHNDSPLPSSTENMHPKLEVLPCADSPDSPHSQKEFKLRTRSALGTPSNYLINGGLGSRCGSPAGNSRFLQKLDQKGALRREEDCLSPSVRRIAETNLSRSSSIASFSGSFHNLSQLRGSMMNLSTTGGEPSPNLSKFRSVNSSTRQSLNSRLQKTSDKQTALIDRLNRLRDSLHSGKNFAPTRSSRLGSSNQTPPMSPAARPL